MYFWCVVLGYKASPDKIPAGDTTREGDIQFSVFKHHTHQKIFLKMIAVAATGGFRIIAESHDDKEANTSEHSFKDVIQRYADHGYTILNQYMGGGKYDEEKLMVLLLEKCPELRS